MSPTTDVLERLCRSAHPRRVKALGIIHRVCEQLAMQRPVDFSLATIGRLSQKAKGPGEGALKNPAGAPYRELIAAHRLAAGVKPRGRGLSNAPRESDETLLNAVKDLALRAILALRLGKLRDLTQRHRTLQKSVEAGTQVVLTTTIAGTVKATQQMEVQVALLPIERDALRDAPAQLRSVGMTIDEQGRIRLPDGRAAFPIGYATAMEKLAKEFGAAGLANNAKAA